MAAGRILSVADRARACLVGRRLGSEASTNRRRSPVVHAGRRPAPASPSAGVSTRVDVDRRQLVRRGLYDIAVESGPRRAHPIRWAGLWRETPAAAPQVRRHGRGSRFTRAKPSWPSSACEPPVRSEPAPAGDLRRYAMRRMSPPQAGHTIGNASAIRATSLAHAMREVSWERVAAIASPSASCADGAAEAPSPRPSPAGRGSKATFPIAIAVTSGRLDREPFESERRPGAVSHQVLEGLAIGTHFGD